MWFEIFKYIRTILVAICRMVQNFSTSELMNGIRLIQLFFKWTDNLSSQKRKNCPDLLFQYFSFAFSIPLVLQVLSYALLMIFKRHTTRVPFFFLFYKLL